MGLDGGWDVSSQKVLGCEGGEGLGRDLFHQVPDIQEENGDAVKRVPTNPGEGGPYDGDETSPPPKLVRVWMGAGTSRPRKSWLARGWAGATRRRRPSDL